MNGAQPRSSPPPEIFFITSAISLYVGASIAVTLFDHVTVGTVALVRVVAAAAILVAWRRPWRRVWTRAQVGGAAAFGITTAIMNLVFYLSADRIDLGASVAIEFIGPIAVAAIGTRSGRNAGALGLSVGGVLLMTTLATETEREGIAYALLAGSLWGAYIVLGRRVALGGGGIDGLSIAMVIGALAIAPFGATGLDAITDEWWLVAAGASVGLLSNVIPYSLDQIVMTRLPRERFALLLALLPATATLIGVIFLAQVPSLREALGIGLIVAGIGVRDRSGERIEGA